MEGNINTTPADLLNKLKAAVMINADISKGGFVGFVNYMLLTLESEDAQAYFPLGGTATWNVNVKNDVLDVAVGGRVHFKKGMFDPCVGVRYPVLRILSTSKTALRQKPALRPLIIGTRS